MNASCSKKYFALWNSQKQNMEEKSDLLDAERRMKYFNAIEDFNEEVAGCATWGEKEWKDFLGRVALWWEQLNAR